MFGVKEINKKEENVCSSEYDNMTEVATDIIVFSKMNNRNNTTIKSDKDYNNLCKSDKISSSSKPQNNYARNDEFHCITPIPTDDGDEEEIYDEDNECFYDQNDKHKLIVNSNSSKDNNNTDLLQVQSTNIFKKEQENNKKMLHKSHQKKNYSSVDEDDDNESNKTDDNDNDDNNGATLNNKNDKNYVTDDSDGDDDDDDDTSSTDSEFSNLSGLSGISGQDWKPMAKPLNWVQKQINMGANPREILSQILSNGTVISPNLNNMTLWKILASIFSEPPRRQKLPYINTIGDVVNLLKKSKNILVLTGAGVSVSCGIPDFRSNNGIYSRLAKDFPDLPDPQAMFDINYFSKDPRPFYKFAREIYPGQFKPSPCHRFIKLLEKKNKLLRNYTQNIDTLEQVAGIKNVIECHGSFATASCTRCKYKTTASVIRDDIFAQRIPKCPKCRIEIELEMNKGLNDNNIENDDDDDDGGYSGDGTEENSNSNSIDQRFVNNDDDNIYNIRSSSSYSELVQNGIMKPDIVFFGEGLPDEFHNAMANDKDECDLLIVIGSSLKVRPVALIPSSIPPDVPQILINREQLNHLEFDVELLGDSDVIINHLCHLLGDGWEEVCWDSNVLKESKYLKPKLTDEDEQKEISDDHYHNNNHHHIRSQTTGTTTALDVDVIADSSSKSASSTLTDGSNSPFCDSGFDSLSSHPGIIEGIVNKSNQKQKQQQQQKQQFNNQHSVIQTFPQIMGNNDHEEIIVFNLNDKKSDLSYSSSTLPSSLSSSSSSSFSLKNNDNNVQIKNCNINSNNSCSNSNFLIKPRNLSIDSSKDSGICDSSNIISISSITNRTNNDNCSSNTCEIYDDDDDNNTDNNQHHYHHKNKQAIKNMNCYKNNDNDDNSNTDKKDYVLWSNNKHQSTLSSTSSSSLSSSSSSSSSSSTSSSSSSSSAPSPLPSSPSIFPSSISLPQKPLELRSIAERLYENTYYHHPSKSSYVFPGAQVFWSSDTENEEEDDDKDNDNHYDEQEEGGADCEKNIKIKNNDYKDNVNNGNKNDDIDDESVNDNDNDDDDDDDDNENLVSSNSENEADGNDYEMKNNCIKSDFKNDKNSEISSKNYYHRKISINAKNYNHSDDDNDDDDDIPPNKRRKE